MTYYKDLTNQKFGELTALWRNPDKTWHCVCSCGLDKDVPTGSLTSGNTRSCGHLRGNKGIGIVGTKISQNNRRAMPFVALERQLLSDPKFVQAIGYIRHVLAEAGCEVKTGYVITDGKEYTTNAIKDSKIKSLGWAMIRAITTDAKQFHNYAAARRSLKYKTLVLSRKYDREQNKKIAAANAKPSLEKAELTAHVLSKLKFSDPESARKADLELVKARRVMQQALYNKPPRTKPMPLQPSESTPETPKDANTPSAGWCKVLQYDSDKSIRENNDESHGDSGEF